MTMTQQTGVRRELEAAPERAAGASLRPVDWRSIEWKRGNRNVRHLQRRIVEAQQQGKKRKVRALQFILTRSYSARCLAVRRVAENPGRRTPGVDGQTLDTPEKKARAVEKLNAEDYQPQPLKRVYIAKKNGKGRRPLGIPTMDDRARQALHLLALDPVAETIADPNSYGFRKGRSVADAIEQCFTLLARSNSPQWILEGDIQSCFDEISHEWLLSHIPMDHAILKKWLEAGIIEQESFSLTTTGTPQGGMIRLVKAADVPIKRHVKIKAAANPYDPEWETYFEERLGLQMKENLREYEKLLKLWYKQNGRCPQCGQKITPETSWHLHHRVWVVNGGDDSMANLVVMHPICHMQLHGQTYLAESFGCCTAFSEEGV